MTVATELDPGLSAAEALERAGELSARLRPGAGERDQLASGSVQIVAELSAARALADQSGAQLDGAMARGRGLSPEERGAAAVAVYEAKLQAARAALEVTQGVFEVMGARSTSGRYGFDRRWRDVRVHSLHDPLAYKAKEVGAFLLTGALPQPSNYS